MLVRCLYASRPVAALQGAAMDLILAQSRKNNPALGITGLLCVSENLFIQVIEGGRDEVCDLFNAIVREIARRTCVPYRGVKQCCKKNEQRERERFGHALPFGKQPTPV